MLSTLEQSQGHPDAESAVNSRRATICILTFGDYLPYYRRCLISIDEFTPHEEFDLNLGFNVAPAAFYFALGRLSEGQRMPAIERGRDGIERCAFETPGGRVVRMWNSPINLYKEPIARLMYYEAPLRADYIVWFDDDSFVNPGWWPALKEVFDNQIDYIGQRWWVPYLQGQTEMFRSQPWYRGLPFEQRNGGEGCWFMTGGFMAARFERLKEVNFPDVDMTWKGDRLRQYGGDTMLGEIARQLGWTQQVHDTSIKVNVDLNGNHPAPRRGGGNVRQFGSDVDVAIR